MVFGLGKKRRAATFKDRVTEFWSWYTEVADRFYQTIEDGRCESLVSEVGDFAAKTLPHLSWVFGAGENEGHSFTVTGEGQIPKQLLAEYWHSRAPVIPHWTFHASRQPTPAERLKDIAIGVSDHEQVDAEKFLLKTAVNDEAKVIDIVAWHPALAHVPKEHHFQILFLLLDEALGEFGTQTWLGQVEIERFEAGEGTRTLIGLPAFIEQVRNYHQWEKPSPLQAYTLYEVREQDNSPRGDTLVGTSCIPDVIFDLLEHKGRLREDPLQGTGAEFAYVAVDASVFPEGQQTDVRSNIEDALGDSLKVQQSGRSLGGAFGHDHSYIDLLLFDGDNSRSIVQRTLDDLQLSGRSKIKSFT